MSISPSVVETRSGRPSARIVELTIDCVDPTMLARFWAAVLDYEIAEEDPAYTCIESPDGSSPSLTFVKVPEHKTVKNRMHFDLNPELDQDEEVARLMSLGAHKIEVGQGEASWVVMADPEGNEFCVLS